jgi:hypothetical protein
MGKIVLSGAFMAPTNPNHSNNFLDKKKDKAKEFLDTFSITLQN